MPKLSNLQCGPWFSFLLLGHIIIPTQLFANRKVLQQDLEGKLTETYHLLPASVVPIASDSLRTL